MIIAKAFTVSGLSGTTLAFTDIGDFNGDGIADFAIGDSGADIGSKTNAGAVYVVYGKTGMGADKFADFDVSSLDGSNGIKIEGDTANGQIGNVISSGDFNRDGAGDLLIGNNGERPAYVVYGHAVPEETTTTTLASRGGFVISDTGADSATANFGSVVGVADVNGDGFDDIIVSASGRDLTGKAGAGQVSVIFGKAGDKNTQVGTLALNTFGGFKRLYGAWGRDFPCSWHCC